MDNVCQDIYQGWISLAKGHNIRASTNDQTTVENSLWGENVKYRSFGWVPRGIPIQLKSVWCMTAVRKVEKCMVSIRNNSTSSDVKQILLFTRQDRGEFFGLIVGLMLLFELSFNFVFCHLFLFQFFLFSMLVLISGSIV